MVPRVAWQFAATIVLAVFVQLSAGTGADAAAQCYNSAPGHCGKHGHLAKPTHERRYTNRTQVPTLRDCYSVCFQQEGNALLYGETPELCICVLHFIGNDPLIPDNSDSGVYYEDHCFACTNNCPASPSENLVENGGFEDPVAKARIEPWLPVGATHQIVTPGHNSQYAAQLIAPVGKNAGAVYTISQRFFPQCNTTYWRVTADYRFDLIGSDGAELDILCGLTDIGIVVPHGAPTGNWVTVEGLYLFGEGIQVRGSGLALQLYPDSGAAKVSVDNIETYVVSTPEAVPGAPNLLVNGDFETGELAPWTVQDVNPPAEPIYRVTSPGANGTEYSFHFSESNSRMAERYSATLSQNISTVAGQVYVMSVSIGVSKSQECQLGPIVYISIAGGDTTNSHGYGPFDGYAPPLANPGGYDFHVYPFIATGNRSMLQFELVAESENYGETPCTIFIDEVTVVEAQ